MPDGHAERQAVNAPIQGFASDICLHALIRLHHELPEGANVLFPIHDAIYLEVRDDLLSTVLPQVRDTMQHTLLDDLLVPLDVEVKTGPSWGKVTKWKGPA
jgi:DNA polymerase-1